MIALRLCDKSHQWLQDFNHFIRSSVCCRRSNYVSYGLQRKSLWHVKGKKYITAINSSHWYCCLIPFRGHLLQFLKHFFFFIDWKSQNNVCMVDTIWWCYNFSDTFLMYNLFVRLKSLIWHKLSWYVPTSINFIIIELWKYNREIVN